MDDADERERKGKNARELTAQFTWPAIGAQLRQLYLRLTPSAVPGADTSPTLASTS
jgi:hypothetical protein